MPPNWVFDYRGSKKARGGRSHVQVMFSKRAAELVSAKFMFITVSNLFYSISMRNASGCH